GAAHHARARLRHAPRDGAGVRRGGRRPAHRDGDREQRDHQAGGRGRLRVRIPFRPRCPTGACPAAACRHCRERLSRDAPVVCGAVARPATAADHRGVPALRREGRGAADSRCPREGMSVRAPTFYAWLSVATSIVTITLKFSAYALTGSVGLLSDAIEAVVNIVAALVALGVLTYSAAGPD